MNDSSKNLIKMKTAAEMIRRHDQFRKSLKDEDTTPVQSIQFSIRAIESYLKYVKSLTRLKGKEVSGVRVVNAIYSPDYPEKEKQNTHTVLFIPTYKNGKGEDEAFDPLYFRDGEPENINELLKNAKGDQEDEKGGTQKIRMRSMNLREESGESSFMNFGGLGRPPLED